MTHFRRKLAVILVNSGLNDDNIRNEALKMIKARETKDIPQIV